MAAHMTAIPKTATAVSAPPSASDQPGNSDLPKLFAEDLWTPPLHPQPRRPAPPPKVKGADEPTRILVAEPDILNQRIIRVLLTHKRIALTQVEHGEAAIDLLAMRWFDLVILDIDSPRMECAETTRWIRYSVAPWSDIPILGIIGAAHRDMVGRLISAGMTDWTPKPLSREDFCGKVVKLMPGLHDAGL